MGDFKLILLKLVGIDIRKIFRLPFLHLARTEKCPYKMICQIYKKHTENYMN